MSILTKIFGSKSDREIKKILPTVKEVNQFYDSLENKDIAFLKQRTKELQSIIKQAIDDQESKKLKNIEVCFEKFNVRKILKNIDKNITTHKNSKIRKE